MDIFDACDALAANADAVCSRNDGPWAERLESIALPGLPPAVAETYLHRLIPLYAQLGTANPVRDVLCNVALQQSAYHMEPWAGGQSGVFLQCGGLGGSAFPASLVCNWRVRTVFNVGWLSPECASPAAGMETLQRALAHLTERDLAGQPLVVQHPLTEIPGQLSAAGLYERSTLHVAGLVSDAMAERAVAAFAERLAGTGMVLLSGARPVIRALAATIRRRFPDRCVRLVDTVTLADGQADRAESLLVVRAFAPELTPGAPYLDGFERLRGNDRIVDAARWPRLDWADGTATGWLSLAGTAFTTAAANLGVRGMARLNSRYRDVALDSAWTSDAGAPSRYRTSFGRVASLPGGSLIDRIPVAVDGTIPLDAIQPYYLPPPGTTPWYEEDGMPVRPVVDLPGTWLALPDTGAPLSHWLLENLLPLLALRELGVDFRLMLTGMPNDYQRTYLELAGFPMERIVVADGATIHRCGRLLVPLQDEGQPVMNRYVRVHHPASRAGIDALMRAHDPGPRRRVNRLYVSRLDARGYRACLNEEEVVGFFRSKGFRIVNGRELTPTQALTAYGNARIVFGPLGAGILNTVFAPPGCQIGTFAALPYQEEFVEQVANLIGHDHGHLVCDYFRAPDVDEGGARNGNFVADIRMLAEMLDEAETRAAALDAA